MENKRKHLEFIQNIITRMANNSFVVKGWTITLVTAVLALAADKAPKILTLLVFVPIISFWLLDGYFLWQERLFRALYNDVAKQKEEDINYSMNIVPFFKKNTWLEAIFSKTMNIFYLTLLLLSSVAAYYLLVTQTH